MHKLLALAQAIISNGALESDELMTLSTAT
jgi:hypothetical protein